MAGYRGVGGVAMPATVNGVDLLIEAVPVAAVGTQETSGKARRAVDNLSETFDRGQDAIVAIGTRLAGTLGELGARKVYPDQVQVEFGLSFSVTGSVIVAGSTVEASLKVTITFDRGKQGV